MPTPPVLQAARAQALPPPRPYITGIVPTASSHLALHHPETEISLVDKATLRSIGSLSGVHTATVTAVRADSSIWSSGKDALVVRWDERSGRAVSEIKANIRKPLPVTALAVSEADNLVIGGTEVVSHEAHILFWDPRNTSAPAYVHSSTHSDEITHLSLLSGAFSSQALGKLLLSGSVDGCVALSNALEQDEEEAVQAEENWNASIAGAGTYATPQGVRVWARSDMDTMASWSVSAGAEGLEFGDFAHVQSDQFKQRELAGPAGTLKTEYLVSAAPSLGVGLTGAPVVAAGTNDGAIVLEHSSGQGAYTPSAFLAPGQSGHADVVRCMYHAVEDQALYTGSEDGVLAAWDLSSVHLRTGAEGEIEGGEMQIDDDDRRDTREERRSKKEKRREKRPAPY